MGGTVEAGPDGMASVWAGFKLLSPDSWHPIPIMIAEARPRRRAPPHLRTFTGSRDTAPPPTGGRLDYGMVNMVRLEDGMLVETWFGMDPLVEMQQMGVAPPSDPRRHGERSRTVVSTRSRSDRRTDPDPYDTVTPFDDIVVAIGPPQTPPLQRPGGSRSIASGTTP